MFQNSNISFASSETLTIVDPVCLTNLFLIIRPLDAFDMALMYQTIVDLKAGKSVNIPIYDFSTHSRHLLPFLALHFQFDIHFMRS